MYYHYEFKNVDSKATQDLSAYDEHLVRYIIEHEMLGGDV